MGEAKIKRNRSGKIVEFERDTKPAAAHAPAAPPPRAVVKFSGPADVDAEYNRVFGVVAGDAAARRLRVRVAASKIGAPAVDQRDREVQAARAALDRSLSVLEREMQQRIAEAGRAIRADFAGRRQRAHEAYVAAHDESHARTHEVLARAEEAQRTGIAEIDAELAAKLKDLQAWRDEQHRRVREEHDAQAKKVAEAQAAGTAV